MMQKPSRTLFARLVVTQVVCGLVLLLVAVVVQVTQAMFYEDGDFDRGMRFHARVLAATLDEADDTVSARRSSEVASFYNEINGFDGRRVVYQVFDAFGHLLHRSEQAPSSLFELGQQGFKNTTIETQSWRTFELAVEHTGMTIIIGERWFDRWTQEALLAWRSVAALTLMVPLVLVGSWFASRHAVQPLRRIADDIASRPVGDWRPLSMDPGVAEVQPLVDEVNRLFQRIQAARTIEHGFFADAAHEIKTPLAVVATRAHLLSISVAAEEKHGALIDLERALERTAHLVSQLLTLAAMDGQHGCPPDVCVELAELLAERLATLTPQADAHRIELSLIAPPRALVMGREDDFISMVDNLVDNAIRYNLPGGRVEVALDSDALGVTLVVSDSGCGIPPQDRERVFERFCRLPDTRSSGSGLGLAIVRRMAERLGGQVHIQGARAGFSQRGTGTAVVVRLPVVTPTGSG